MNMKQVLLITLTFFLIGCGGGGSSGLGYKKYGVGTYGSAVGYSDFQINDNQWRITYTGQANTSYEKTVRYMYQRAKEICLENGFKSYEVSGNTQGNKDNGSTNVGYGQTYSSNSPISSGTVSCK